MAGRQQKQPGARSGSRGGKPVGVAEPRVGFRPRLLPVLIFCVALMISLRVGDIWLGLNGAERGAVGIVATAARAQGEPAPRPNQAAAPAAPAQPAPAMTPEPAPTIAVTAPPSLNEPKAFTQAEIDVLEKLADRREAAEARERELDRREGMLKAAETRIDQKIVALQKQEESIRALLRQYDEKEKEKVDQLVKIYGAMKPKDAARVFDQLEMPILLDVVAAMSERKVAPIMAEMEIRKARALTEELATRRRLPLGPEALASATAPAPAAGAPPIMPPPPPVPQ